MKKFTVTMEVPSVQTYVYEVEAKNEEKALHLVLEEDESVEHISYTVEEEDSFGDMEIKIEDVE